MTAKGFDLGDYVEVPDRIVQFYRRYPEGRIAEVGKPDVVTVGAKTFIGVTVAVFRTADDPQPCIGTAWEPFPGATPYTRDSEMMNAATSAIGRALVAAGILAKGEKIASREEVEAKAPATLKKYDAQIKKMTLGDPAAGARGDGAGTPPPAPAAEDAPLGLVRDRSQEAQGSLVQGASKPAAPLPASPEDGLAVLHDDRQPLYELARTLKLPRTAVEVDNKIAKQGLGPVRVELILAHGRDCKVTPCQHVAALSGFLVTTSLGEGK